jgi:hypothetical protein
VPDSSALQSLLILANKCPFEDGIAVYQARAALYQFGYLLISNACESTAPIQRNQKRLGRTEEENTFTIYPNPTSETINVVWERALDQRIHINVLDSHGKLVKRKSIIYQKGGFEVDLSPFVEGIYFIEMQLGEEFERKKVVLTK